MIRTYSELSKLKSFDERYKYLQLDSNGKEETFGFDRFLNQNFYKSREWKVIRDIVIIRDNGCDLGIDDLEIKGKIIIHHMNPILPKDFETQSDFLLNPEYLVCTTHTTHNAIHYGDESLLIKAPIERSKNDTCPWKK
ncbi:hypothetical protein AGMMS49975_11820 [Clostridia bacterium]|nr:hypothetical protein AGMMS49975_11820 [Clostridia bacterium]